jgi:hypothetical protein
MRAAAAARVAPLGRAGDAFGQTIEQGRAVSAALSPETDDAKAAGIAMRLIEQADPPAQATLEIGTNLDSEAISRMSLSELMKLAEAWGIDYSTPPEQPALTE